MPLALRQEQHRPPQVCSRIGHRKESPHNTVALKCELANRKLRGHLHCPDDDANKKRICCALPVFERNGRPILEQVWKQQFHELAEKHGGALSCTALWHGRKDFSDLSIYTAASPFVETWAKLTRVRSRVVDLPSKSSEPTRKCSTELDNPSESS